MLGSIAMSCGLTAVMSLIFHREVRGDMIVTGFVCAVVIDRIIDRITGQYRRRLALANQQLEERVRARTSDLEEANRSLREAARAEQALRDELMTRDRMAQAGMLAAGVSHEIKSPLSVIVIAADEIGEISGAALPAEAREMLADVAAAAASIGVILRDLNALARPVDDPLTAIELATVVDTAARLAAYQLGPDTRLVRGALVVPPVTGNLPRLVQLVLNLIVNAARATRPGAPNAIEISATATAGRVVLAVSDTGSGMSPATLARIFEPYFTTGARTGGTGLGLPICKSIVERMGGSIEIASELGAGTTVYVSLQPSP
jgi:signal transduction histidine kinase